MFTTKGAELLKHVFIHLIRNSMDHGIESGDDRESKGKTRAGTISIDLNCEADHLKIVYHDDGKGLNIQKLRTIAREKNIISASGSSLHEIAEVIFSTRTINGERGFSDLWARSGYGCHTKLLEEAGGQLDLVLAKETVDGHVPVKFELQLPFDYYRLATTYKVA